MSDFVGLHVHSECSFLDGYASVEAIAKRAVDLGQTAVALTDHGEVNGHMEFAKACKKAGVHGILGMEGYWVPDSNLRKEVKNSHITLLAQNNKGLQNLYAWTSLAYEDRYRHKRPLADIGLMREYGEGIYASDGCLLTDFGRAVAAGDEDAARQYVGTLLDIFGDRFFMELHTFQIIDPQTDRDHELNKEMTELNQAKLRLSREFGVPLVVVNDAHYAPEEDWENHRLVWDMNTNFKGDQTEEKGHAADWMMGDGELIHWMSKHGIPRSVTEEAIKNTAIIAADCNAEITTRLEMPRLTKSEQDDLAMFLDHVQKGFERKVEKAGLPREEYYKRLEEEVTLIAEKGFSGYFNIVADLTKAAKSGRYIQYVETGAKPDPLLLGPGRGSAGGSLVAYLMDITELDPIKYGLLFGRFLTPGRKGYPDIDIDLPQSKRPGMKQYMSVRHGHDHVCGIGTRSRSGPKQTLRDLCRVMKISYSDTKEMSALLDELSELEPEENLAGEEMSWDEVLEKKGGDLAPWVRQYPGLFEKMQQMVGLARQAGTHAAGLLVSSQPLLGSIPTRVKNGVTATQFDMWELEELGGVKMDLLGIRHLDTLSVARQLIQDRHGVWLDYERWGDAKYQDPAIWGQMDDGDTLGVFQMETASGTKAAQEFKPRSEVDVATLAAVNRPGVIDAGLLPVFMRRRAGDEDPKYDHPLLEGITGNTYGILVFQEQLFQAVQTLAGWSVDQADDLRIIVGKKLAEQLVPLEAQWYTDCLANPVFVQPMLTETRARQAAGRVWNSIQAAGRYSFNKSHAVGYGLLATWEVWTKHYYPAEFMVALLMTDPANTNKYVRWLRRQDYQILPPDINLSDAQFTIDDQVVRYGLESVRGVGKTASKDIVANRPYTSLTDYLGRTNGHGGNKKTVVDALIKIGAFDCFADDRNELLNQHYDYRILQDVAPRKRANLTDEERALILEQKRGKKPEDYPLYDFSNEKVVFEIERELVGRFVTVDPMYKYLNMINATCIKHPSQYRDYETKQSFFVGGEITEVYRTTTKRTGEDMAILTLTWSEHEFKVLVFPKAWNVYRNFIEKEAPVACRVIKLDRNGCHLANLERLDFMGTEC